jgi:hypothetical protein
MPKNWRMARSLERLLLEINAAFPRRSKLSDGGIGDAVHASKTSDHNPHIISRSGERVVTARDFTHDPEGGLDCRQLADALVELRDRRIKYIIWQRRILSSKQQPWVWRAYSGENAHNHHLHISVDPREELYDNEAPWNLFDDPARTSQNIPQNIPAAKFHDLKKGDAGADVFRLQERLVVFQVSTERPDGIFGARTEKAVKRFQALENLRVDGIVGPNTAKILGLIK